MILFNISLLQCSVTKWLFPNAFAMFFNCLPLILVLSSVTSYIALSRLGKMNCESTECYIRLCRQVKLTEYKHILSAGFRFVSHRTASGVHITYSPRCGCCTALLEQGVWRETLQFFVSDNVGIPRVELCCCMTGQNTGGKASSVDSTPTTGWWGVWL